MTSDSGIIEIPSHTGVDETVEKLKGLLQAKGITLFASIDHSGEAAKAGLKMPPTKLLIFGSPKAGTPVMLAAPGSALDLPLKTLVREDGQGRIYSFLQRPAVFAEKTRIAAGAYGKHNCSGNAGGRGSGVVRYERQR